MRLTILIAAALGVLCAASASADRIIFAPTGTVLGGGEIKAEGATSPSNHDARIYWLGVGLQRLELNAVRFEGVTNVGGASKVDVAGAEVGILPETTLTPGIGLGVWDLTDKTPDGIGYYLAISKALPVMRGIPAPIRDVRVDLGFGVSGIHGFFAGAEATVPFGLKLSGEYFQKDFNFAVGLKTLPGLQIKLYRLDSDTYYGLQFSPPI